MPMIDSDLLQPALAALATADAARSAVYDEWSAMEEAQKTQRALEFNTAMDEVDRRYRDACERVVDTLTREIGIATRRAEG